MEVGTGVAHLVGDREQGVKHPGVKFSHVGGHVGILGGVVKKGLARHVLRLEMLGLVRLGHMRDGEIQDGVERGGLARFGGQDHRRVPVLVIKQADGSR